MNANVNINDEEEKKGEGKFSRDWWKRAFFCIKNDSHARIHIDIGLKQTKTTSGTAKNERKRIWEPEKDGK